MLHVACAQLVCVKCLHCIGKHMTAFGGEHVCLPLGPGQGGQLLQCMCIILLGTG